MWLLFLTGLLCCKHSPVGISMGANREGKVLATLAHLRGNAMNIFTYMYTKGEDTLNIHLDWEDTAYF